MSVEVLLFVFMCSFGFNTYFKDYYSLEFFEHLSSIKLIFSHSILR